MSRFVGRISGWNDDKGYGFVVPHDGGGKAFVHIKAFQLGSRRPVDGDLISYAVAKDERGRLNASDARFAGQRLEQPTSRDQLPRAFIGCAAMLIAVGSAILGWAPLLVPATYALLSSVAYVMYTLDKAAAKRAAWRTPESSLHLVDLLGGWPGALIAQQQLRHKTAKASFQFVFWITVAVNIALVVWFVRSEHADRLARALLGG